MNKRTRFSPYLHRQQLVGFMSAYDHDDLPDGAWQAVLEDGAAAFTRETGIVIDTNEAFHIYVKHIAS